MSQELFNRSNNTLKPSLPFVLLFIYIAVIAVSYVLIAYLSEALVYGITIGAFLLAVSVSGALYLYYANKFKKALEE